MTKRAVILGLVGVILICGLTYFNDAVLHQTNMVGNFMPISVYGGLLLFVIIFNPLLRRIGERWALSGTELAVVLALILSACCLPGSGLMRVFTSALVLPYHWAKITPSWQADPSGTNPWRQTRPLIEQIPPYLLTQVTPENDNDVLTGFIQGKGGNAHITPVQVPWSAWWRTLGFWLPLLLLLIVGFLGLSLVVHPRWAHHEHLPYPIATLASSLLPDAGRHISTTLRNPLFWAGLVPVLLIHLNNYACQWPHLASRMIPISLRLDFSTLSPLFPVFARGGWFPWLVFGPFIYFAVIGVGYYLSSDVSLSLGIGPTLFSLACGILAGYGVTVGSGTPALYEFVAFGAYFGLICMLFYTGRRYFSDVCRAALGFPTTTPVPDIAVWGARIFVLASVGFILYFSLLGKLEWPFAALYLAILVMMFLGMSRILAETGVFFIQNYFAPHTVLLGLFGAAAIGPQAMLLMALLTVVFAIDPREAFMPFFVNTLKIVDTHQVRLGGIARLAVIAVVVGLVVAVGVTLYLQYDRGANMPDAFATRVAPTMAFDQAVSVEQHLAGQGMLRTASAATGWGHLALVRVQPRILLALGAGLVLLVLCYMARLRWPRWPLHPVLFLVWVSFPAAWFAFSFLLGWAIKALVLRFGGFATYQKYKPLMAGLIAGEFGAGVLIMLFCWVYYLLGTLGITQGLPKGYWIYPG